MIGFYNPSVILTYLGVIISIIGCKEALLGNYHFAFVCLIGAGICDIFDGKVARRINRTPQECSFGVQIDSLADVVNFGVFPVIIGFSLNAPIVICLAYILAAIIRLGYYNIIGLTNGYFSGLPVTFSALFFPLFFCVSIVAGTDQRILFIFLMFALSILFISPIKIKKPKGVCLYILVLIEILMAIFLLMT